jgi:hypothetical protein
MIDRGYTTRPVGELSAADLLEEALQSAYDSGYYSGTDNADAHERAMKRRDACFAELRRRLENAVQLEGAASRLLQHRQSGDEHPVDWQRLIEALEANR